MRVFAPAKINLFLHIHKKLDNGYHHLDSLVSFVDVGDEITIEEADGFHFAVDGPFSGAFSGRDLDSSAQSSNLVVKAVWRLAQHAERAPNVAVTLTKNLPLGAGVGGGSSDAAAVIWGLCTLWDIPHNAPFMDELLLSLGADVPVCFHARSARMQGIGDVLKDSPALPEIPIVMVYPSKPCVTADIFQRYTGGFRDVVAMPRDFGAQSDVVAFLKRCENALTQAAINIVPDIQNALMAVEAFDGCDLARMSGSGSCVFGLFENHSQANAAAKKILDANPDWWVRAGTLGNVERY